LGGISQPARGSCSGHGVVIWDGMFPEALTKEKDINSHLCPLFTPNELLNTEIWVIELFFCPGGTFDNSPAFQRREPAERI
jgi:hypothetical protein